jgi:hypothetical protein
MVESATYQTIRYYLISNYIRQYYVVRLSDSNQTISYLIAL